MKILYLTIILFAISFDSFSQSKKINVYSNTQNEIIFSYPNISQANENIENHLRLAIWFHINKLWHIEFTDYLGIMTGIGIRNLGFITTEDYNVNEEPIFVQGTNLNNIKTKRRSYTLGVPLAVKLGTFKDHFFIFAGGEYELLFHYKQKYFINDIKYKETEWFSNRTNLFLPSLLVGIQFPKGIQVKFKYYLDDFLNTNYTNNSNIKPYAGMNTQLYYVSFSFHLPEERIIKPKNETIAMKKK